MAALYWTFIVSTVLCYAYAAYVILCAIALTALCFVCAMDFEGHSTQKKT